MNDKQFGDLVAGLRRFSPDPDLTALIEHATELRELLHQALDGTNLTGPSDAELEEGWTAEVVACLGPSQTPV